jgi:hypothetical protein
MKTLLLVASMTFLLASHSFASPDFSPCEMSIARQLRVSGYLVLNLEMTSSTSDDIRYSLESIFEGGYGVDQVKADIRTCKILKIENEWAE